MIKKIILLPFALVKFVAGLVFKVVSTLGGVVFSVVRFIFNHVIGTALGAIIGLLFGRKHVGFKLFSGKKKKPAKKAAKKAR